MVKRSQWQNPVEQPIKIYLRDAKNTFYAASEGLTALKARDFTRREHAAENNHKAQL